MNKDRDFLLELIIELKNAIAVGELACAKANPLGYAKGSLDGSRVAMLSVIERIEEYLEGNPE